MAVSNPSSIYPSPSGGGVIVKPGKDGLPGKSAYEIALDHGYVGSEADWLDSLIGPPGVDGNGKAGDSAYEIAKQAGFEGTKDEWLQSLQGGNGKSAYEIAKENGFEGTEEEWLESLKGLSGKSAYEIAVDNGFEGTKEEWLESLVGEGSTYVPIEGDVPLKPVTKAEYDALPEEERQSETAWLITDADPEVSTPTVPSLPNPDGITYTFGHGFKATTNEDSIHIVVNAVSDFEGDNTLPIQAVAVQTIVGNINALLTTI